MKAFFDIDTQIDFVFPAGALYAPGAERILPAVSRLNRYAAANGIALFSTMCAHGEDTAEFRVWPPHCVAGTAGQQKPAPTLLGKRVTVPNRPLALTEVLGEQNLVEQNPVEQILVEKDALDLFTNPNMEPLLHRFDVEECFVYGVLTEYCVRCAVMGLLARGAKVSLIFDATAHLSAAEADRVLHEFISAGGKVISAAQCLV